MGIELVLPQSRTPAVEKKKEILHRYRTSVPAVPHSAHGLQNEVYIHVYRMQIFVDCETAGAEY